MLVVTAILGVGGRSNIWLKEIFNINSQHFSLRGTTHQQAYMKKLFAVSKKEPIDTHPSLFSVAGLGEILGPRYIFYVYIPSRQPI